MLKDEFIRITYSNLLKDAFKRKDLSEILAQRLGFIADYVLVVQYCLGKYNIPQAPLSRLKNRTVAKNEEQDGRQLRIFWSYPGDGWLSSSPGREISRCYKMLSRLS